MSWGHNPPVVVRYGTRELVLGTDYTVEYRNNAVDGNACAVVTACDGRGFAGQAAVGYRVGASYDLAYGAVLCMEDADGAVVPFNEGTSGMVVVPLTEGAAVPAIKVGLLSKHGGTVSDVVDWLGADDFSVTYGNNTKPGSTGWLMVTGKGTYSGSLSANFRVIEGSFIQEPDAPVYDRTPQGYARMLYGGLLGNAAPNDFQVSWWAERLTSGDPASAVAEFCSSDAFLSAGHAPEQAARALYAAVLGNQSPTDYQVSFWASYIAEHGASAAAAEMCRAEAFQRVCEEYSLK